MKHLLQRFFRGILSVFTTCVLMAAPVAAIVYSSDSTEQQAQSLFVSTQKPVTWQMQNNDQAEIVVDQENQPVLAMKLRRQH